MKYNGIQTTKLTVNTSAASPISGSGQVTGDNCFSTTYKYSTDGTSGSITITGTMD